MSEETKIREEIEAIGAEVDRHMDNLTNKLFLLVEKMRESPEDAKAFLEEKVKKLTIECKEALAEAGLEDLQRKVDALAD